MGKKVKIDYRSIAVAIKYAFGESGEVPKIVASGRGKLASQIIEKAQENNIPVEENPEMAGALAKLEVGTEIPEELWEAMAEILAQIYLLDGQKKL